VNTSFIQLHSVSRWFGSGRTEVRALTEINLALATGEQAVVVGPSGSGKTTLLNLVGALDRPSQGRLIIAGETVSSFSEQQACDFRRYKVGFVFQDNALLPELTVAENIEMPLVLVGQGREQRHQRVAELLQLIGLEKRHSAFPAQLSGGEKQRVAVARAVSHNPQLVLADEPTANLDAVSAAVVIKALRQVTEQQQLTLLISTHDPRVFNNFARVIRLADGLLCAD